jgi:hypothetical protein
VLSYPLQVLAGTVEELVSCTEEKDTLDEAGQDGDTGISDIQDVQTRVLPKGKW